MNKRMKFRADINYEKLYGTSYLTDSDDSCSIDGTDETNSTDVLPDKICENKIIRKRKKNGERAPSSQHSASESKPEFSKSKAANLKHSKPNNNSIRNNQTVFSHTTNAVERIGGSYSNAVNNKPRNVVIFTDSMLKTLCMKEFNKNLNGSSADLKSYPAL